MTPNIAPYMLAVRCLRFQSICATVTCHIYHVCEAKIQYGKFLHGKQNNSRWNFFKCCIFIKSWFGYLSWTRFFFHINELVAEFWYTETKATREDSHNLWCVIETIWFSPFRKNVSNKFTGFSKTSWFESVFMHSHAYHSPIRTVWLASSHPHPHMITMNIQTICDVARKT